VDTPDRHNGEWWVRRLIKRVPRLASSVDCSIPIDRAPFVGKFDKSGQPSHGNWRAGNLAPCKTFTLFFLSDKVFSEKV
jgi:hypothetical protein